MSKDKLFAAFNPITKEDWIAQLEKDLKGKPYEELKGINLSGIEIEPVYHTESAVQKDEAPGSGSFRRGAKSVNNEWVIESDYNLTENPKDDNQHLLALLNAGLTGITLIGQPTTETLKDILPQYITLGLEEDTDLKALTKTLTNSFEISDARLHLNVDPIGEASVSGRFNGLDASLISDSKELISCKHLKLFSVNAQHYHNAGGNAVSELAFALAHAHEYLVFLLDQGKTIDEASALVKVQLGIGGDYFAEIAKVRAFRVLWARMIESYQPQHNCSKNVWIHSISSQFLSTVYDPYVNMLRGTTQAMSAVLGGADMVRVLPFNKAYSEGEGFSKRIARNVQILLQEESYFDKVIDPAGGAYYVEHLTNELAAKAWAKFQKIEKKGGFIGLMTSGNLARELKEDADAQLELLDRGQTKVLGVTLYPNNNEKVLDAIQELTETTENIETDFAPIQLLRLVGEIEEERLNNELKEEAI